MSFKILSTSITTDLMKYCKVIYQTTKKEPKLGYKAHKPHNVNNQIKRENNLNLKGRKARIINNGHFSGLPWWPSVWEPASQCWGYGFNLWSRRIPHVSGHLSWCTQLLRPCAATTEALGALKPVLLQQEKPLQ